MHSAGGERWLFEQDLMRRKTSRSYGWMRSNWDALNFLTESQNRWRGAELVGILRCAQDDSKSETRLWIDAVECSCKGDGFADVVEAADPGYGALDAHAEAGVGYGAVLA